MGIGLLHQALSRVRWRLLLNALAVQFSHSVSAALCVFVFAICVGTDLINLGWIPVAAIVALAIGALREYRRRPGFYQTAQLVDRRLALADTISTAVFFQSQGARAADEEMCSNQLRMACELAGRVSSQAVAPFRVPRAIYYSLSLALLALGLVVVRYRLEGRLDLHPPMAAILKQLLRTAPPDLEKLAKLIPKPAEEEKQDAEVPEDSQNGKPHKGDPSQRQATKSSGAQKAEKQNTGQGQQDAQNQEQPGDPLDENDASGQNGDAQQNSGQRNAAAPQQGQGRSGQRDEKSASNSTSDGESGAFSKMRDALSQMLSMLKPSPGSGSRQQISANRGGRSRGGEKKGQSTPQEGSSSDDASSAEGSESPQPGAAKSGSGQGKDSDSAKQAASGAGNNEGKKDIHDAEMLQAMGKISTIFGKRSENMSGTAEVEVVSGNQQLATSYESKAARHTDTHAAADRDEVPIELQNYVQRYFNSVHATGETRRTKTK